MPFDGTTRKMPAIGTEVYFEMFYGKLIAATDTTVTIFGRHSWSCGSASNLTVDRDEFLQAFKAYPEDKWV